MNILLSYCLLVFIVVIFFSLSSCSNDRKVSRSIVFWSSSLKHYFTDYMKKVIENFERIYGIDVYWQDYPLDSVYQKILTTYGSDISADVININPLLAAGLYKQKIIVDISLYDKGIQDMYYPNLVEGCRIGDSLITVPWYSSTKMLIYNKQVFDFGSYNIGDYEVFFDLVVKIKKDKGVYGFYPFIKFEQDMLALGLINDPRNPFNEDVLDFFGDLREIKDYLPSGFIVSSVDVAYSMYKSRKVASILIGPQFLYRVKKEDPELYKQTDVLLFPFKYYPVSLMSLSIVNNRDIEKINDSIVFIKYLTNFENQNEFFKIVPILPSIKGEYDTSDEDYLIAKVKQNMIKIFPSSKVFDLYFYEVLPDPLTRSSIFKNFINDVFNSDEDIKKIGLKYSEQWNENIKKQ